MSVKITDEQADQIIDALWAGVAPPISAVETPIVRLSLRKSVRLAYERALNPKPAEPEIPVSLLMESAGRKAFAYQQNVNDGNGPEYVPVVIAIYRAMELQRRKEEGVRCEFTLDGLRHRAHRRASDGGGSILSGKFHRRKDDP